MLRSLAHEWKTDHKKVRVVNQNCRRNDNRIEENRSKQTRGTKNCLMYLVSTEMWLSREDPFFHNTQFHDSDLAQMLAHHVG